MTDTKREDRKPKFPAQIEYTCSQSPGGEAIHTEGQKKLS